MIKYAFTRDNEFIRNIHFLQVVKTTGILKILPVEVFELALQNMPHLVFATCNGSLSMY
jgi:hypothetical protein